MKEDNVERKLGNLEEWNNERAKVKPFIDIAVDYHNRARLEARWKNYEAAGHFYREAIENYRNAVAQNPKYYLQDLLDRIDHVIEEYINNTFNLKRSGNNLKNETGIHGFINFVNSLKEEERNYIDPYDITLAYLDIADFYYEDRHFDRALEFYEIVLDANCDRPFVNRNAYFKIGKILFKQSRFKEALVSFVSMLSFDKTNKDAIDWLERCLEKLGILEYKDRFLTATPSKAKKLIMEVL